MKFSLSVNVNILVVLKNFFINVLVVKLKSNLSYLLLSMLLVRTYLMIKPSCPPTVLI